MKCTSFQFSRQCNIQKNARLLLFVMHKSWNIFIQFIFIFYFCSFPDKFWHKEQIHFSIYKHMYFCIYKCMYTFTCLTYNYMIICKKVVIFKKFVKETHHSSEWNVSSTPATVHPSVVLCSNRVASR